jgi:hypothetical protein
MSVSVCAATAVTKVIRAGDQSVFQVGRPVVIRYVTGLGISAEQRWRRVSRPAATATTTTTTAAATTTTTTTTTARLHRSIAVYACIRCVAQALFTRSKPAIRSHKRLIHLVVTQCRVHAYPNTLGSV